MLYGGAGAEGRADSCKTTGHSELVPENLHSSRSIDRSRHRASQLRLAIPAAQIQNTQIMPEQSAYPSRDQDVPTRSQVQIIKMTPQETSNPPPSRAAHSAALS